MWKAVMVGMICFVGSLTPARAEQLVLFLGAGNANGPALDGALGQAIQFPESFPRVMKSAELFGQGPATDVVAFGACDKDQALAWVKVLKVLGVAGVQARGLKAPATITLGCPQFDEARLKRLTVLQKPLPNDGGVVMYLEGKDLVLRNGQKQAFSLFRREGLPLDAWAPPPPKDGMACVAFVDRQLGLLQTDCAEPEGVDNCFVTQRIGYALSTVGGALKAKPAKPKLIKRECAE